MNILLIEDDVLLSELISDFLSKNHEVVCAYSGDEAYDILDEQKFSLIITDINMPHMTGLEFLKSLREFSDTTPVIIITAYQDLETLKKGFEYGANDYLKKPFELEELEMRVKNIAKQFNLDVVDLIDLGNNIKFNLAEKKLIIDDMIHVLKPKESQFLNYLITHSNSLVSSNELMQNLSWKYDQSFYVNRHLCMA